MTTKLSVSDELTLDHPSTRERRYEEMSITPTLAEEWLGRNHLNRTKRPSALAAYVRDMEHGKWLITGESIKFDWNGDLIDGQHRLEAVIGSGRTIVSLVAFNLDPDVKSVLDVNVKRSGADALKFNGHDSHTTLIASVARIAQTWEAGKYYDSLSNEHGGNLQITNSEVVEWYESNLDINEIIQMASQVTKYLDATLSATAFAMFLTFRVDAEAGLTFWSSIANAQTEGRGDPRLALINAFATLRDQRMASRSGKRIPIQLSLYFRAWNLWRAGKSSKHLKFYGPKDSTGRTTGVTTPEPK